MDVRRACCRRRQWKQREVGRKGGEIRLWAARDAKPDQETQKTDPEEVGREGAQKAHICGEQGEVLHRELPPEVVAERAPTHRTQQHAREDHLRSSIGHIHIDKKMGRGRGEKRKYFKIEHHPSKSG